MKAKTLPVLLSLLGKWVAPLNAVKCHKKGSYEETVDAVPLRCVLCDKWGTVCTVNSTVDVDSTREMIEYL